jgi:putative addiction module component (TIGR02574 family)
MSRTELLAEAKRLSVSDRLALIDQLIESVESEAVEVLSPESGAELDRRYQAFRADPTQGEPWEVVRESIISIGR